jgi:hypothetical protein
MVMMVMVMLVVMMTMMPSGMSEARSAAPSWLSRATQRLARINAT